MRTALTLLFVQGCLGGFDTLWYHEFRLHLPRNPSARNELTLHSSRDFIYAVIFSSLAWLTWGGFWACILGGLLIFEIIITLQDFIEEDRWRKVPSGERVMHALMGIMYGAFLAYLVPELIIWLQRPSGFTQQDYGWLSWTLSAMALGVTISGARDLIAAWPKAATRDLLQRNRV
jgi:uncharacterized protein